MESSSDEEEKDYVMSVIIDEDWREKQLLLAMKRTVDGEPIIKQPQQDNRGPMPIDNFLNPEPGKAKDKRRSRGNSKIKGKTTKARPKRQSFHADHLDRYGIVSALMNAKSGLKFEQLL